MINKNVWGVVSCPKIEVTFSLKRIKLAGKSVCPSAVGESALGGKFVQILHRDHSVPPSLSVRRENTLKGESSLERFY